MKFWNPTSIRGNGIISLQMQGSVCGERKVLIFGGKILALTFYRQEGTLNFIEKGNRREVIWTWMRRDPGGGGLSMRWALDLL
jgi:hypothetical protein